MHLLVDSSFASKAVLLVRDICGQEDMQLIHSDGQQGPSLVNGSNSFHSMIVIARTLVSLGKNPELLGTSPEDVSFVEQWLITASRLFYTGSAPTSKFLESLNSQLITSVYLVGNRITLADVVLYVALHNTMKQNLSQAQKNGTLLNLCRWFDHVYHECVQFNSILSHIPFYIPSTIFTSDFSKPLTAKGSEQSKGKKNEKQRKGRVTENKKQHQNGKSDKDQQKGKKEQKQQKQKGKKEQQQNKKEQQQNKNKKGQKKDKKDKKQKQKKPAAGSAAEIAWRLNVLVGKIKSVRKHKSEGDRMFVTEIDCGEEKHRMVVMGVVSFCKQEDLMDRVVMVIINVKPAEVKGEYSNGRVLVATSSDKTIKEIVNVPEGAKIGERVKCGDSEKPPDASLSNKNMHKLMKQLRTSDKGIAQCADQIFLTSAGPCSAPSVIGGTLA